MSTNCISPNFEIGPHFKDGDYILEFPAHIRRDDEHDPILTVSDLIELRYLIDQILPEAMGLM